ncbi:hypothetical protein H2C98_08320 [Vibrio parahaemolyticus]|uniref:hypothetical protein n=1 Tax=Vibrio parahaemolyticus TaxID=670 RepID=UPI00211A9073|nr:hypothetical protein [Vibrio parahaemolyticus]MCQ9041491.1 hypothetical protein [Vibrio parahaemolyticus]
MNCPMCFFRDVNQRHLKLQTFSLPRFESKLLKYKELYLDGINNLTCISKCDCYSKYNDPNLVEWIGELLNALKASVELIATTFDEIFICYYKFLVENQRSAINYLHGFLNNNGFLQHQVDPSELVKVLFRARYKGDYESSDIKEFFHIPFTLRHLVGSQRFSINGQPLLYLGSSILTVEKELESNCKQLNYSAFLPSYSDTYQFRVFDLKNSIDYLMINLPGVLGGGVPYDYDKNYKHRFELEIRRSILLQICSFPTEIKKSFIPEYVIPQMLTAVLQEAGFDGLTFPSTKCFESLVDSHRFSSHHLNIVLFTSYSATDNHDISLLNKFYTYTHNVSEVVDVQDVLHSIGIACEANRNADINNSDFIFPLVRAKLQIEYLQDSKIDGIPYFSTQTGIIELQLYKQLADQMYEKISERVA